MNRQESFLLVAIIIGAAVWFAFPQFMFGVTIGLGVGIAVEAKQQWFVVKQNTPQSQPESTQLESVTITERRVPLYHQTCDHCGTKVVSKERVSKCPSCGANL